MISICRLCPSTDIETIKVAKSVIFALVDRKRKVRQAALELLAVLAQLSSIALLLDIAAKEVEEHPKKEKILHALRNRYAIKHVNNLNKTSFI